MVAQRKTYLSTRSYSDVQGMQSALFQQRHQPAESRKRQLVRLCGYVDLRSGFDLDGEDCADAFLDRAHAIYHWQKRR